MKATKVSNLAKVLIGLFVFMTSTALWFWAISSWSGLAVFISVVYTAGALLIFDRLMINKWPDQ